ncbi:hypothetical protein A2276_08620 [candidate division WOR-1 bacterium RIFOXYA12_FULL_43_27]|nr:MAG: hypothetical protein A2276_08620 [candidate division WOR-1 bacterium RIFOXYA12_FULL_43_27]OGI36122.1 MAG: hypothetical protein A2259_05225 [Candidatus Moranbacteria bacterium RIFOXYA2_FULL_43_15]
MLFPISCVSCEENDTWLCPDCFNKIEILSSQVCPYCEKNITDRGETCPACKNIFLGKNEALPLDGLVSSTSYNAGNISRLVHLFKYNFVSDIHFPLGKILTAAILKNNLPIPNLIIPVPLHPRRLRWRGFNQAELLANRVSENLTPGFSIPVFPGLLIRQKYTAAQMKIKNYKERQRNLKDAFTLVAPFSEEGHPMSKPRFLSLTWTSDVQVGAPSLSLEGKTVLLIDDICTTGSTLFECGKTLKQNGAKKVFAAVIARQEIKKKI